MALTTRQRRRLQFLITRLVDSGDFRLGDTCTDFTAVPYVMAYDERLFPTDIQRSCSGCGLAVFTAGVYPDDVALLCPACTLAELEREAAES